MDDQTNTDQTTAADTERTDAIADAQKVILDLRARAAALVARQGELADLRRRLAYASVAERSASATKELAQTALEGLKLGQEHQAVIEAMEEADRRLEQVQAAQAVLADRDNAREARKVIDELVEHGKVLDDALADVVQAGVNLRACLSRLHSMGFASPGHEQLATLGNLAIRTAPTRSIWSRYFEAIAPRERRSFVGVVAAWRASLMADVERRLGEGEQTKETEAA